MYPARFLSAAMHVQTSCDPGLLVEGLKRGGTVDPRRAKDVFFWQARRIECLL